MVTAVDVGHAEQANGFGVVYAGTEPSAVFRSETGGDSWVDLAGLRALPSADTCDLRHTCITKLAESQASEQTLMAIAGHVSKRMLAHHSHIRMAAKRAALDGLVSIPERPVFEAGVHQSVHQIHVGNFEESPKSLMSGRIIPLQNVPETWFTPPCWTSPARRCPCHGRNGLSWKNACGSYCD
jgi:hypothetical protein